MSRSETKPQVRHAPAVYQVGKHEVGLAASAEGRWTVAVDGVPLPVWFTTMVDAWTAGVIQADRLDRPPPA